MAFRVCGAIRAAGGPADSSDCCPACPETHHSDLLTLSIIVSMLHTIACRRLGAVVGALLLGVGPVSAAQVRLLAGWMERFSGHPLVLDPVMWSSSGTRLCSPATVTALRKWLLPLVSAITPNAREAGALLGRQVSGSAGRRRAAAELSRRGPLVVLTGGDSFGDPVDYLGQQGEVVELPGRRLPGTARGTGCRFSSVLAVLLARGLHAAAAVRRAAAFTRKYIEQSR